MELDKFYKIIGQTTYSLTKIDFLISYLAVDLNIVETPYDFFAINSFEKKLKELKKGTESIKDNELKKRIIEWLDNMDELRKMRNSVVHSIILQNSDNSNEYRLFNYQKKGDSIMREIVRYETKDFEKLNQDLIEAHNDGYDLWIK